MNAGVVFGCVEFVSVVVVLRLRISQLMSVSSCSVTSVLWRRLIEACWIGEIWVFIDVTKRVSHWSIGCMLRVAFGVGRDNIQCA